VNVHELIGYLASLLVLATFCMSGMVPLRAIAIASNVAFIGYAALEDISPVLVLHAILLPMNVYRLLQAVRARRDVADARIVSVDLATQVRKRLRREAWRGRARKRATVRCSARAQRCLTLMDH